MAYNKYTVGKDPYDKTEHLKSDDSVSYISARYNLAGHEIESVYTLGEDVHKSREAYKHIIEDMLDDVFDRCPARKLICVTIVIKAQINKDAFTCSSISYYGEDKNECLGLAETLV